MKRGPTSRTEDLRAVIKTALDESEAHRTQERDAQALIVEAFKANRTLFEALDKLERANGPQNLTQAAWRHVYDALWRGVQQMNKHAMAHPEEFGFAAEACYWPVIKSPGKGLEMAQVSENDLFPRLRIGTETMFSLVEWIEGAKWSGMKTAKFFADDLGLYAFDLLNHVVNGRLFDVERDLSPVETKRADEFRKQCAELPQSAFQKEWEKWWRLAKEVFEFEWENDCGGIRARLAEFVSPTRRDKTPRTQMHNLANALKSRFKGMAGQNRT